MMGARLSEDHSVRPVVTLSPTLDGKTFVHGNLQAEAVALHHEERVILGGNPYFRLSPAIEVKHKRRPPLMPAGGADGLRDFEFAKKKPEMVEAHKQIEMEVEEAGRTAGMEGRTSYDDERTSDSQEEC